MKPVSLLDYSPEVAAAFAENRPIVALESTIIAHGMPYPENVQTALELENIIREAGAVPATIAILKGRLKAGLRSEEIEYLGKNGPNITKVSRRDLPLILARQQDGATTVAATMIISAYAKIPVFATGGIGGVHRGAAESMDISADLQELAHTNVAVVSAGAKAILDLALTLEYLETQGVPVIGYRTREFPAFYTRKSGLSIPHTAESPTEIAKIMQAKWQLNLQGGLLIANPIPEAKQLDYEEMNQAIDEAIRQSKQQGIQGKAITPFLLSKIKELTAGRSLSANIELVRNNVHLATAIAKEYQLLT